MATNPNPAFKKNTLAGLSVPTSVQDPNLRVFLQKLKEHIELSHGNSGQPFERFVTLDDLKKAGIAPALVTKRGRGEISKTASSERARSTTAAAAAGATNLSGLNDVSLIGPLTDDQVLAYNATISKWRNQDAVAASDGQDADDTAISYFLGM